jgi:hypothetical protein
MALATSFCTQIEPSDKEVFLSIGTIRFYDSTIISKCLDIVKKKQGLAAKHVLALQEGKRPPQLPACIKTGKSYREAKIELLQTQFPLKGEK